MFEQEGEGVRTFEDGMARDGRGREGRGMAREGPLSPNPLLARLPPDDSMVR